MRKTNNTIWGLSRASASERRMGRFLRSDEGHADAAAGDAAGGDAGAEVVAGGDAVADPVVQDVAGSDDGGSILGDAKVEGDEAQTEAKTEGDADAKAEGEGDEAPKPYEGLVAPEGFASLDTDALAEVTPLMRKFGVGDDQAQDFLNEAAPVIKSMIERGLSAATEQQRQNHAEIERGWVAEMQAHPEFGGQNFEQSKTLAARAIETYFPADFRTFLNESRLGQNPAMFEGLARIGKEIAEDTIDIAGGAGSRAPVDPLYGANAVNFLPPDKR